MKGYFSYWNHKRHYGFITCKLEGGWLEKYFALETEIIRKEVEPDADVRCEFDISAAQPRITGGYPIAASIQVLAKPSATTVKKGGEGRVS
jgi:hypothetical protein